MDSGEVMMKDTATSTALSQQSVASNLEDPSQMDILDAPGPTGYIPLLPLYFDENHAGRDSWPASNIQFPYTGDLGDTQDPGFPDGLESQRLHEWDMVLSPDHLKWHAQYPDYPIQYMVASIITPLRDDPNTEGFHSIGESYARSPEAFENYKMAVIDPCDRAMGQPDSSWLDQYYAAAIYNVRAESVECETRQKLERQSAGQDTSVLAVVSPYQFDGASPLSVTSAESESVDDISQPTSPTTLDLSTSVSSLSTDSSNSYYNSPTTAAAGSPTLPAPQNPAADTFRCHSCKINFYDRANLRRHETISKRHGDGSMYSCLMPGCAKSYTRLDNLRGHVKKAHGDSMQVPRKRGVAMKRKRRNNDAVDITARQWEPAPITARDAFQWQSA